MYRVIIPVVNRDQFIILSKESPNVFVADDLKSCLKISIRLWVNDVLKVVQIVEKFYQGTVFRDFMKYKENGL